MHSKRLLQSFIEEDLSKKMVFVAGPRQVGKTTLAKKILKTKEEGIYLLWDNRDDRKKILRAEWPAEKATIVFDELHKYRKWKGWLKGEFDKHRDHLNFLVTGSARMDIYRRGGDSLQGRYHHYRLHPLSINELLSIIPSITPGKKLVFSKSSSRSDLADLLCFSGFPEPLFSGSKKEHRRWQKERLDLFFREDVRDLENIRDLSSMQIAADLLPFRVGSKLSLNALREDLEVSHKAINHWMDILERLYFMFRLRPFTNKTVRGLKKEAKPYLWDWSLVSDPGGRFENLIASHLLKFCHFLEDTEGYAVELFYLRDAQKREVDFVVTFNRQPWFAVEAKLSDTAVSPHLRYFGDRLRTPFLYQVVLETKEDVLKDGVRVMPATTFLSALV